MNKIFKLRKNLLDKLNFSNYQSQIKLEEKTIFDIYEMKNFIQKENNLYKWKSKNNLSEIILDVNNGNFNFVNYHFIKEDFNNKKSKLSNILNKHKNNEKDSFKNKFSLNEFKNLKIGQNLKKNNGNNFKNINILQNNIIYKYFKQNYNFRIELNNHPLSLLLLGTILIKYIESSFLKRNE